MPCVLQGTVCRWRFPAPSGCPVGTLPGTDQQRRRRRKHLLILVAAGLVALAAVWLVLAIERPAERGEYPTLADFWEGRARFVVEVTDTGLPMGESDTVVRADDELWTYVHAS
ncbi:MAG: hypothetical protein H8E35_09155, partial [Ardenticatenia bacterium]|nr:hypothetical protein [Ardenticatenia bacterium]